MDMDMESLRRAADKFPKPIGYSISYGTAGFRADASLLAFAAFRTGILAALRSLYMEAVTGLMITASHNQISDNGMKVADPGGDMLAQDWEPFANDLVNCEDTDALLLTLKDFAEKSHIVFNGNSQGKVILARDTRPSGETLLNAAKEGVEAIPGVMSLVHGVLTTPQLHWMVWAMNKGLPSEESQYYCQLSNGFRKLLDLKASPNSLDSGAVVVDCANGIGAIKLLELLKMMENHKVEVRNSGREGEGLLNDRVGADFIQKEKMCPLGFNSIKSGQRCASLDGDADRLVYFYVDNVAGKDNGQFHLLDGDKILVLFTQFIMQQLALLCNQGVSLASNQSRSTPNFQSRLMSVDGYGAIKLGVVQTAYANGASTSFLEKVLGAQVVFTSTGVKYLHKKAVEFDIGLYFEANGHGMILFRESFINWLQKEYSVEGCESLASEHGSEAYQAGQRLLAVSKIVNQAVGDALSGLLLVEAIMQYMDWSIQDWNAIYSDFPSRQLKVKVPNRDFIKTTDAERRVISPLGLQDAINAEVGKFQCGRAFVRPSGTEDVVRVYAEAKTQGEADTLASAVAEHVSRLA